MGADLERLLTDYHLSTLLLAKKLEALPQRARDNIYSYIENELDREEQLRRAIESGSVSSIDRSRPNPKKS